MHGQIRTEESYFWSLYKLLSFQSSPQCGDWTEHFVWTSYCTYMDLLEMETQAMPIHTHILHKIISINFKYTRKSHGDIVTVTSSKSIRQQSKDMFTLI